MKDRWLLWLLLLALAGSLAFVARPVSAHRGESISQARRIFPWGARFEATIYRGPDAGLSLRGTLTARSIAGSGLTTGRIVRKHGPSIPVVGRIGGGALNLFFDLGGPRHIFAVGTAVYSPRSKRAELGGPLVGPRHGDSGDWVAMVAPETMASAGSDPNQYVLQYYNSFKYVPSSASMAPNTVPSPM